MTATQELLPLADAIYSETIPASPGFYVYRLWEASGICLYVGMVGRNGPRRVQERFTEHSQSENRAWWHLVARIDVAALGCAEDAAAEEKRQLAELRPAYSKRSTGRRTWPGLEAARREHQRHKRAAELARVWVLDFAGEW